MNMYFIAIVLPAELNQKVQKHKEYMFDRFGSKVGLKSPAHITLVPPFWMEAENEERLFNGLEKLSHFRPFFLQTNDFSAFKPKTIFIALSPQEELERLKKNIDDHFKTNSRYKIKTDPRPFHPHITIATRD